MPATSKMFDLGNYTIDTDSYSLPSDAKVSGPETLEWSWNDNEKTIVSLLHDAVGLKHPELNKINISDYATWYMRMSLMSMISRIDGTRLEINGSDNFTKSWNNLNAVLVTKPYGGYLAVSALHPTLKVYIGLLDRFDYLVIYSTESDEMIALIMRELKIYPKEESNNARLQAIQKML